MGVLEFAPETFLGTTLFRISENALLEHRVKLLLWGLKQSKMVFNLFPPKRWQVQALLFQNISSDFVACIKLFKQSRKFITVAMKFVQKKNSSVVSNGNH